MKPRRPCEHCGREITVRAHAILNRHTGATRLVDDRGRFIAVVDAPLVAHVCRHGESCPGARAAVTHLGRTCERCIAAADAKLGPQPGAIA